MHFSGNLFFILFTFFFTFPALSMFWLDPFFDSFFVSSCFFPVRFLVRFWPLFFLLFWSDNGFLFGTFLVVLVAPLFGPLLATSLVVSFFFLRVNFITHSGNFWYCCTFLDSSLVSFWHLFSFLSGLFLVFFMTLFCSYVAPLLVPVSFCAPFSTFLERLGSSFLATCFLRLVWPKTA